MTMRPTLSVVPTSIILGAALAPASRTAAAETESGIAELVTQAKSSADQQRLVRWYDGRREDEVRKQADLFRKLALNYRDYRIAEPPAACEEITRHYDDRPAIRAACRRASSFGGACAMTVSPPAGRFTGAV